MSTQISMRDNSHTRTVIAILAAAVTKWKDRNKWSRETVTDAIVNFHVANKLQTSKGLNFIEAGECDEYTRLHTNANKLFRWLDELTKDNNLLPVNFAPSILGSLPTDIKINAINEILITCDCTVNPINSIVHVDALPMLEAILHDSSEASKAVAALVDGIDPGELERAQETITLAIETLTNSKNVIDNLLLQRREN